MQGGYAEIWRRMLEHRSNAFLESENGVTRYKHLTAFIRRCCADFDNAGMASGDRLVIVTSNDAVAGAFFVAALLDGKVPVMLSAESRVPRVSAVCASVAPKLLVLDESKADALGQIDGVVCKIIPEGLRLVATRLDKPGNNQGFLGRLRLKPKHDTLVLPVSGREPQLPPVDTNLAYILFTSGTTSSPSGVEISRRSLLAHLDTQKRLFGYARSSRILNATPLAHTDGLVQGLLNAVVNTATLLRPGAFNIAKLETWLDCLTAMRATHFVTNPTVLSLIHQFAQHDDYFDHPDFFGVLCSASVLRSDLWAEFESRFSCDIYNLYGMTETVANATYAGRHREMGPVGTIGVPIDCEVRLMPLHEDAVHQQAGIEGEIQIKGNNVFLGYWKDQDRTSRTFTEDGWMRTGDLAKWQSDGSLQFRGRLKTIINVGGLSVLPAEIDEALLQHPAVIEAVTVGVDDAEFEEVPIAAVTLSHLTSEQELTAFCRETLEPLKVPRRILQVQEIPKGGAGKPRISELRALLQSLLSDTEDAGVASHQTLTQQGVLEMAAGVFRVPVGSLTPESNPDTVEGWDSFTQLNLIIAAEAHFGKRITAAQVAGVRDLADLYRALLQRDT